MRSRCYGVTSGCFSDYSVDWVFTTREAAEAWAAELNKDAPEGASSGYGLYDVQEFAFYDSEDVPVRLTGYEAIGEAGSMEVRLRDRAFWEGDRFDEDHFPAKRPSVGQFLGYGTPRRVNFWARCQDKDAAIKSVKDRLAAALTDPSIPSSEQVE